MDGPEVIADSEQSVQPSLTISSGGQNEPGAPVASRKRVLSNASVSEIETNALRRKRPRVTSVSTRVIRASQTDCFFPEPALDRLPRSIHDDDAPTIDAPYRHSRALSRGSSYSAVSVTSSVTATARRYAHGHSRSQSVASALTYVRLGSVCSDAPSMSSAMADGMAFLRRTVSEASLQEPPPLSVTRPETSAQYHLRNTKVTIDFSLPTGSPTGMLPMSWSSHNIVVFARGNRVHYKSVGGMAGALASGDDIIGQLCRVSDTRGDLRAIECAGTDAPHLVALGTSTGYVQIWDLTARKATASWTTKGVSAIKWNGSVLTVGLVKGTIQHFDIRIKEMSKLKEQARKVTRHQTRISSLAWNCEGKLLASGDESGMIHCWDARSSVPLDVGEMVQRRKKMQHGGIITALAWCPWKPKLFASGDSATDGTGTVCLWDVNPSSSYQGTSAPEKLQPRAQITSLHFSPHCKELLSTHGPGPMPEIMEDREATPMPATGVPFAPSLSSSSSSASSLFPAGPNKGMANSIAVHTVPSLQHVVTVAATSSKGLSGSVLNASATKVMIVVPEDGKLKVWDVWGKLREGKKHSSFMGKNTIR